VHRPFTGTGHTHNEMPFFCLRSNVAKHNSDRKNMFALVAMARENNWRFAAMLGCFLLLLLSITFGIGMYHSGEEVPEGTLRPVSDIIEGSRQYLVGHEMYSPLVFSYIVTLFLGVLFAPLLIRSLPRLGTSSRSYLGTSRSTLISIFLFEVFSFLGFYAVQFIGEEVNVYHFRDLFWLTLVTQVHLVISVALICDAVLILTYRRHLVNSGEPNV
jgi:hypothetical protein